MKQQSTFFLLAVTYILFKQDQALEVWQNWGWYDVFFRICSCVLLLSLLNREESNGYITLICFVFFWKNMFSSYFEISTKGSNGEQEESLQHFYVLLLSCVFFVGVHLFSWLKKTSASKKQNVSKIYQFSHPEDGNSILSHLLMKWVLQIIWTGFLKNKLQESDVPDINVQDKCQNIYPAFSLAFRAEEQKCELEIVEQKKSNGLIKINWSNNEKISRGEAKHKKPNILLVLIKIFGLKYFTLQTLKCILDFRFFLNPLLLEALMKHIQQRSTEPAWKGYTIVLAMFFSSFITTALNGNLWVRIQRLSKQTNMILKLAIFNKSLTASNERKTTGELLSLLTEDCDKIVNAANNGHFIILTPIQVSLCLYMLYIQLGGATFVGMAIMLLLIPLNAWAGRKLKSLEQDRNSVKDVRVKIMNEVLGGIKVLKLYAWEKSFVDKVLAVRDREITIIKRISFYHGYIDLIFRAIPFMVRIAGFGVFLILGGQLDPAKAFVVTSLFAILNGPFSMMSLVFQDFVQASVAIQRLNSFFSNIDITQHVTETDINTCTSNNIDIIQHVTETNTCTSTMQSDLAIQIKHGTFSYERSHKNSNLQNVNLTVRRGKFVAIIGMVGAGKSSILSAILGEMEKCDGTVSVHGSTALVSQDAWIQNASMRDNILFGSEFDGLKYNKVIEACALRDDLSILPGSDSTEIGERGVNLSGGQKQRVSLARAVYHDADIYLLDDPLSSVDAHVGKHIFNQVLGRDGLLKDKTRILVTHGIQWLPYVDEILVMKDGKLSETVTYKQLLAKNGQLVAFLRESTRTETEENRKLADHIKKDLFSNGTVHKIDHIEKSIGENNNCISVEGKLMEEETAKGDTSWELYAEYLKSVGVKSVFLFIIVLILLVISRDFKDLWLGKWTEDILLKNTTLSHNPDDKSSTFINLTVFGLSGGLEIVLAFMFLTLVQSKALEAAGRLHNKLLTNIMRAPMSFFESTPAAHIINRFSKDMHSLDGLGPCLDQYMQLVGNILLRFLLVIIMTPGLTFFLGLVTMIFLFIQKMYVSSARQLRLFSSKSTSPISAHFKETLEGVVTIRAFKSQKRFSKKMEQLLETHLKFDLMETFVCTCFGIHIALVSSLIGLASGLVVLWDSSISSSMAGLTFMYSSSIVMFLGRFMQHAAVTEQEIVSLENIIDYSRKPTEAAWEIPGSAPLAEWPQYGQVTFDHYKTRYREGLDLVLNDITCNIRSGEKVGIVGRTGAGKSSLIMALFRLLEASAGDIIIDGCRISKIGLHDLRRKITILPQDPVLFSDSLRMNLDPFKEKTDADLMEALKHAHLHSFVSRLPRQLDFCCGEGGKNLSVGQRQLVCLARTFLRKTKILVLDEATAAVDVETDELIQKTICREFKDCTVLTIAHRLNTIIDYDRILVLDHGCVKEFDSPRRLLADNNSMFYSMARDSKLI
ncbi:unnamed protein product [Lymnaea stagnalis]|uniref:Uncharacterized protein n=1 Tax=Lymnaea stagnalis TaxID=6523 RepID=A0AAV2HG54_LYMST